MGLKVYHVLYMWILIITTKSCPTKSGQMKGVTENYSKNRLQNQFKDQKVQGKEQLKIFVPHSTSRPQNAALMSESLINTPSNQSWAIKKLISHLIPTFTNLSGTLLQVQNNNLHVPVGSSAVVKPAVDPAYNIQAKKLLHPGSHGGEKILSSQVAHPPLRKSYLHWPGVNIKNLPRQDLSVNLVSPTYKPVRQISELLQKSTSVTSPQRVSTSLANNVYVKKHNFDIIQDLAYLD